MEVLRGKKILLIAIASALLLAGSGFYIYKKDSGPLPKKVRVSVKYPLYYPANEAAGYKYQLGSAKNQNDIIFYTLQNGSQKITVSQQAIPESPPDINHIPGFKKLDTFAGDATVGLNSGQPTAILLTNTTLVTLSGNKDVPQDNLVRLVQSMNSLD